MFGLDICDPGTKKALDLLVIALKVLEQLLQDYRWVTPESGTIFDNMMITDDPAEADKLDIFLLDPTYQKKRKNSTCNNMYEDNLCAMFMCPVTGLEMNSKLQFILNFTSGKADAPVPEEAAYDPMETDEADHKANLKTVNPKIHNPKIRNLQPQPATATATATCNRNLLSVYKTHTHTRNNDCARNNERARDVARVARPGGLPGGGSY